MDIGYEMSLGVLVCLIDQNSMSDFFENFILLHIHPISSCSLIICQALARMLRIWSDNSYLFEEFTV